MKGKRAAHAIIDPSLSTTAKLFIPSSNCDIVIEKKDFVLEREKEREKRGFYARTKVIISITCDFVLIQVERIIESYKQ